MAFSPHASVGGSNSNQREMTKEHRTLVDNAFEEGHYESGIAILTQVHYPSSLPSKDHVRQLLYIALYPHSHSKDQGKGGSTGSPAKPTATKSGAYLIPSPAASSAAMSCLLGFVYSNSPAALLRGLPSHPAIDEHRSPDWVIILEDDFVTGHDSKVAKEADRFKQCKDCWSMLEENFIPPPSAAIIIGPPSPSKRRRDDIITYHTPRDANHSLNPVGPEAWPVLHWLLTIFERDQDDASSKGEKLRYSPLLLSQIPPTRSDSGAKWDVNVPLEIAFFCLEQEDGTKREMGNRLLSLLINLTSTTLFDLPLFVNSVANRLSVRLSPETSGRANFLLLLPANLSSQRFKVHLCQTLLSPSSNHPRKSRPQPRAQARPVPSRARRQTGEPLQSEGIARTSSSVSGSKPDVPSLASRHPLPPASEIIHLFTSKSTNAQDDLVKLHLFRSYLSVQQATAPEERSQDWETMRQNGSLREVIEKFGSANGEDYQTEVMKDMLLEEISA